MTSIDYVIQPGEDIPDDVTEVKDAGEDFWRKQPGGMWSILLNDGSWDGSVLTEDVLQFCPLTVTAVREPERPMPRLSTFPDEAQYWTDDADGDPAFAGREQPAASISGLCEVAADGVSCSVVAEEHRRIYHGGLPPAEPGRTLINHAAFIAQGCCGMVAVHMADCPKFDAADLRTQVYKYVPQQADASPVLDLVQQHASEWAKAALARRRNAHDEASAAIRRSQALLDRIAALVPQQPVQARDGFGIPWMIHACGAVMPTLMQGTAVQGITSSEHHCYPPCPTPGPWRPLLVGGDPAPEKPDLIAFVMAELGVGQRAFVLPMLKNRLQAVEIAEEQRDEARTEVERYERLLKSQAANFAAAAQPDPLVLSLPEVPEGTEALVGVRTGRRYALYDGWWKWDDGDTSWAGNLTALLAGEGSLRVELAPPPEPRTWAALKPGPDPVDLPQYVTVEGWGSYGRREDGLYANTDGYPDDVYRGSCLTFAALRALGNVTEGAE